MSKTVDRRNENKLDVIDQAEKFAAYTIKICSNKKVFLPEYYDSITSEIIRLATDIYINIFNANDIRVMNESDCRERLKLQRIAKSECKRLYPLIQLCKPVFHFPTRRLKYWNEFLKKVKYRLEKWNESDRTRYSEYL